MKQKTGDLKKKFILYKFTRELIRHSAQGEVSKLKNILNRESKKEGLETFEREILLREKPIEMPIEENYLKGIMDKDVNNEKGPTTQKINEEVIEKINPIRKRFARRNILPPLIIPKQQLPQRFQYLKPIPSNLDIDLDKLNPLIKDSSVREIECFGANKNIVVSGAMGRKKTEIKLAREEIENIIKKFSEKSRIPMQEGFFKVVVGRLMFSAVISNIISSKFVIKKIDQNQVIG